MFKTILLDIDGTMLDSRKTIITSFQIALKDTLGITKEEQELQFILGLHEKEAALFFTKDEEKQQTLLNKWTNNVKTQSKNPELFPYVYDTLIKLKSSHHQIGIVTSKTVEHMRNDFDKLKINDLFDTIVTSDDVTFTKPNAEPLLLAIERCGSTRQETIYIGDTYSDYLCSKNSGVAFALAKWGSIQDERIKNDCFILNQFDEILSLILV